jgi:hypothetical protein
MKRRSDPNQLPNSPIQEELEAKVKEMLGPDYTNAPATLDTPTELKSEEPEPQAPSETAKELSDEPDQPEIPTILDKPSLPGNDGFEDPALEKVVDEIEHQESDRLLQADDAELEAAFKPQKIKFSTKLKNGWVNWWSNPLRRTATLIIMFLLLVGGAVWPTSRYFVLNNLGVRAKTSLQITDSASNQPIKNATVVIGGVSAQTDDEGKATLDNLKLGKSTLQIKKRAYAEFSKTVVLGWGSNPLGEQQLTASGEQYTFVITDYLSGKPIVDAEASLGGSDAQADDNGIILLATEPGDDSLEATISAKNYRVEKIELGADAKTKIEVKLVPSRKSVFISKRSGKYDLYKVDIDGKGEELVLAGSGVERPDITLLSHPSAELVALVSTRENVRTKDGYLLSTLTLINLNDKSVVKAAQAEKIQLLGWSGTKLYFVQTVSGASANNPNRQKIISYDSTLDKIAEVASSNYFNDQVLIGDSVYYSPSSLDPAKAGLYKASPSGSAQTIFNKEVWNIYRLAYDKLVLAVESGWQELVIGSATTSKISGPTANPVFRQYVESSDGSRSLWIDQRDGKGVLLSYDKTTKQDTILASIAGLKGPVRWLNDKVLIYRINSASETADYALNIEGGEALKIRDVTDTQ